MNYIPRLAEADLISSLKNRKILIILGARQVGKTTLLSHLITNKNSKIFNLDLEVDKAQLAANQYLSPEQAIKNLGSPPILIIDEAQRFPEISRIAKGWFDNRITAKIILSGSSSLNLLNQSAEALTGRNEKIWLTPLVFKEILSVQPWYQSWRSQPAGFTGQIRSLLLQSLIFGSYPETIFTPDKPAYLLNLTADYLFKDIFQSGINKNPDLIKRLLLLLAYQIGSIISVNELASSLQTSRQTITKYLHLLEQTFVIFRLGAYNTNLRKEVAKSKKVYFWDTGVRNAIIKEFSYSENRSDIGRLWENWVVAEFAKHNLLNRQKSDLYFWRSRNGAEVDLIIKHNSRLKPIEIKWSSRKTYGSSAFTNTYKNQPLILTKDNFTQFIPL